MESGTTARGRSLVKGNATGPALVLHEPLSFWGGFDAESGRIIDRRHPQLGACVTGKILFMPSGRGSSSSSSVLAEAIRAGTAPAGIVLAEPDGIVALGALVARELYGSAVPVVVLESPDYGRVVSGVRVEIENSLVMLGAPPSLPNC